MVFSDLFFLFVFIPAFALCYLLAAQVDLRWLTTEAERSLRARNLTLVVFSLIFYAWGEPVYVWLMLVSVLINYLMGRAIDRQTGTARRVALIGGLCADLVILGIFKYAGFFPVHVLPHRRVSSGVTGSATLHRLAALYLNVSSACGRSYCAL